MTTAPTPSLNTSFLALVSIASTLESRPHSNHQVELWPLNEEILQCVNTINIAIICAVCCLGGIVTNIINIVVIAKMKFRETINIALMGLTISDLCVVTSLLWFTFGYNPLTMSSKVSIPTRHIMHHIVMISLWTHAIFGRLSGIVTMYISLERCLSIAFPLRIKSILTPKRVLGIMIGIYVTIIGSMVPNYHTIITHLENHNIPYLNTTIFLLNPNVHLNALHKRMQFYFNVIYTLVSIIGVIIFTFILVWKLQHRGAFVSAATSRHNTTAAIQRNLHAIKMVICVATVFIVSFIPSILFYAAVFALEGFYYGGKHQILFGITMSIPMIFGSINSSVNIFIYYKMSSRYALAFRSLFGCRAEKP